MKQAVEQVEVRVTREAGEAARMARDARRQDVDVVVAAGGDGTVHEVVNGLLADGPEPTPSLFHLPTGTGCDFARSLGLSQDADAVARGLAATRPGRVDVGFIDIDGETPSRRWFINGINIGLGAGVLRRLKRSRGLRGLGRHGYLVAAGLEVLTARPLDLVTCADGAAVDRARLLHLAICNGRYLGGGMQIPGGASLESGRLQLVRVEPLPRLTALVQLRRAMEGRIAHRAISGHEVQRIEVTGVTDGFEIDGELCGASGFRAGIMPGALRVRVPRPPKAH